MTTAKISSGLQEKISLYLKSTESRDEKQNNGMGELPRKLVSVTHSSVERTLSNLQGTRASVGKHSSFLSRSPLPQNQSSPLSQNTDLKQQNTSNKPAGSPAGEPSKNLNQELKAIFAKTQNQSSNVTNGSPHKQPSAIQQEIAQAKEKYRLEEPNRKAKQAVADAKVDAKVALAQVDKLAQQAGNKTSTKAESTQVKLQFDANGVPTSAPPLPPSSLLTPSRGVELSPGDKSKPTTRALVKPLPNDLMQQLNEKLANIRAKVDNDPAQLLAEAKENARVTAELKKESAQQVENKTSTKAEPAPIKLQFDANGIPTSVPPPPPPSF
ncbi:TPA: hypothetical protein PXM28_000694 [Yersinia enterocolitica]|nr:hypothetical protein [Yersinia enterocolitica]